MKGVRCAAGGLVMAALVLVALPIGAEQVAETWLQVSYGGVVVGRILPAAEPYLDGTSIAIPVFDAHDRPTAQDVPVSAFEVRAWRECDGIRVLVLARLPADSDPGTVHENVLNRRSLVATELIEGVDSTSDLNLRGVRWARSLAVRLVAGPPTG